MKGVFPTPDTWSFFPSDTDIWPKINVAWHRHSELVTRHLTLHTKQFWQLVDNFVFCVSTSARHWQSHSQVNAGHYAKFRVDTRHSDSPSWALIMKFIKCGGKTTSYKLNSHMNYNTVFLHHRWLVSEIIAGGNEPYATIAAMSVLIIENPSKPMEIRMENWFVQVYHYGNPNLW